MRCHIDLVDGSRVAVDPAPTECGDYCEFCGDCLHCYGAARCPASISGNHFWAIDEAYTPTRAGEILRLANGGT